MKRAQPRILELDRRMQRQQAAMAKQILPPPTGTWSDDHAASNYIRTRFQTHRGLGRHRGRGWSLHSLLLNIVHRLWQKGYAIGPDTHCAAVSILTFSRLDLQAFRYVEQMKEVPGIDHPSVYLALLKACGKAGNAEGAMKCWEDMKRNGTAIRLSARQREMVLETLAQALAAGKKGDEILRLVRGFRDVESVTPSAKTYHFLLHALPSLRHALPIFKEMKRDGHSATSRAYEALLQSCADEEEIRRVFWMMRRDGIPITDEVWASLMQYYAKSGNPSRAVRILGKVDVPSPRMLQMVMIAVERYLEKPTRAPAAVAKWIAISEAAFAVILHRGVATGPAPYEILLSCYAAIGDTAKAEQLREYMVFDRGVPEGTHTTSLVRKAYEVAGDEEGMKAVAPLPRVRAATLGFGVRGEEQVELNGLR